MKIRWNNLALILIGLVVLLLWLQAGDTIRTFLANIKNIGPGHSSDEQTQGLIALGFLCAAFIAGFRLLLRNNN